ncbi:hypothetical protein CHL89_21960 [Salmonella enterica]|uniref:Uncharacterized protein n=1 Tax=Salmonella enterica subsp. houtenae serovar 45:g,z51:- TaxID=1967611 RepID=A0A753EIJ7_SALHO|nr:hypothetical protein [Salmonella enterica]EBV4237023.1 hypothetical protein [Salmonella enterica subsp. enterica serovar Panama]ECC2871796.1 hypothetical protein [Salmonella enterica subsp. enterica serovar Tanger]EDR7293397.1 hypothetical protein [Salmonella enterica subsp. enterica serovar Pomona]EDS5133396.1 hypothetical protein [Salmonella enterica subsp. enterica serovar Minnesota]EDW9015513.1 hypothetical protein [Salmonella enterica subsp. enterica serovar 9,12:-:1,5]EDX3299038.1 hy
MRLLPEDSARLLSATACFLRRAVVLLTNISLILPSEWPEISSPESLSVAEFSYPQITARDLSIRLQPLCLQSAIRPDFKVRGFL